MVGCLAGADWWTYDLAYLITVRIYITHLYYCYLPLRPCDTNNIPTAHSVTYPASESIMQTP
jgi:hypothetical protein